jgi:hypothetical protein
MEFDLEMNQRGFIAQRVLPVLESMKQAGPFGKIPIEQLLKTGDTARAPGAGYSRGKFTFTKDSFSCEEHGWEEPVDDREAEMYADYFDAEQIATMRAYNAVLLNAEKRAAALLFNTSTWTPTTITHEWDDASSSVPITDVETAVQTLWAQSGLWANALIVNRKVFRNLRLGAQVVDRMKYQGFQDVRAGNITASTLAQVFDLDEVIVAGSAKDTAKEGQDTSISPIWSDEYAMVARIARTNDIKEPCVGRTIHWGADGSTIGGTIETYRDETVRSDITRVRHDVDEKVLYVEAAVLLDNVTT